ncbi:MAG: hypothetical protein DMF82_18930 [Acidobacteria bacterium]|nr:MAG: hypothetical protein DMF82_18930 [Acidobacteriota bacterium]
MPSLLQIAMGVAGGIGLTLAVVGVLRRGLHHRCWSFLIYLLASLVYGLMTVAGMAFYDVPGLQWPQWFWSWELWHLEQTVLEVVKLALAIELGVRVVAAFPGTWRLARSLLAAALLTTTAAVTLGGAPQHPLLASGTIWLFAAVSLVVILFNLPLHAWYRALLVGFVPYLFVFSSLQSIMSRRGYAIAETIGSIDQVAYLALVGWWVYAAWRDEEKVTDVSPAILRRLGLARG